jgi:MFS family permease
MGGSEQMKRESFQTGVFTIESSETKSKSTDDNQSSLSTEDIIGIYIFILSVVIDIIGLAMVIPILPYYAESLGADAAQLGILYSAFSASECVGNLLMGTLSDIFGRRALIIISLFGSFSGYLFHGLCRNYNYLLAARIYTGFFSYSLTMA